MQMALIQNSGLKEMDKQTRKCIWGGFSGQRKLHLVSWEKFYKSKEEGGIGVRQATEMNKALLARLGWRRINEQESLWSRLLLAKYERGENGLNVFKQKKAHRIFGKELPVVHPC